VPNIKRKKKTGTKVTKEGNKRSRKRNKNVQRRNKQGNNFEKLCGGSIKFDLKLLQIGHYIGQALYSPGIRFSKC
jgi:hypothetical protein